MTPEQQAYLPAIAEHAKEWVEWDSELKDLRWKRKTDTCFCRVVESELLQLMQWIEEREGFDDLESEAQQEYYAALCCNMEKAKPTHSAHWHERWQAICKVKGWKETL